MWKVGGTKLAGFSGLEVNSEFCRQAKARLPLVE
ncbi:hypothetical protein TNIN_302971, partial [Trichonephila inaurata madagascariensis]